MAVDVLASDIGEELLVAVRIGVQNQTPLAAMLGASESFAAQEKTELERHVEAREFSFRIQLHVGDVVNSVLARANDLADLVKANFAAIEPL